LHEPGLYYKLEALHKEYSYHCLYIVQRLLILTTRSQFRMITTEMHVAAVESKRDRIILIDALRGYALMGLFLVHMVEYFELYWYAPPANTAPVTSWVFGLFGGKAYAMFALLFGVSFYIILKRNADRGVDFRGRFVWRVILLLIIGYLHGLIYSGDVLQVLAVAGLLLVPLWLAPSWVLLVISAVLLLQSTTFGFIAWMSSQDMSYAKPFYMTLQIPVYEFYAHGTLSQVLLANAVGGTLGKWSYMLESGRFANIIGLALLGFWLAKINFFTHVERYGKFYLPLLVVTAVAAIGCVFANHAFMTIPHPEEMDDAWAGIIEMVGNTLFAFTTVWLLIVIYQNAVMQRVLNLLAAPGRMTLSMYVGQSVLMVPVFYNFGAGAYRWMGQGYALLLAAVLWSLQVAFARWWLARYNYGPLEWCWRAATYGTTAISFRKWPHDSQ
jgi:uncharacterized protein